MVNLLPAGLYRYAATPCDQHAAWLDVGLFPVECSPCNITEVELADDDDDDSAA